MDGISSVASYGTAQSVDDRMAAMFKKTDTNGDGSIDEAEFEAGAPQGPPPGGRTQGPPPGGVQGAQGGEPNLKDLFSKIDTDGDGKVSKDEFTQFMKQMHGHHKHHDGSTNGVAAASDSSTSAASASSLADDILKNTEADESGAVTTDAFVKALTQAMSNAGGDTSGYAADGTTGQTTGSVFVDQKV